MAATVHPVIREVHSQEGEEPGENRVPWQRYNPVVVVDVDVARKNSPLRKNSERIQ